MKSFKQHVLTEAFTRQHYELLAKLIKELGDGLVETKAQDDQLEAFAEKLADLFKQDNPRFDKGFFLAKCGY